VFWSRQQAPCHFEKGSDRMRRREVRVHRELGDLLRQRPSSWRSAPQNRKRVAATLHVAVFESHVEHRFFAGFRSLAEQLFQGEVEALVVQRREQLSCAVMIRCFKSWFSVRRSTSSSIGWPSAPRSLASI
jgi:hypothetical protein